MRRNTFVVLLVVAVLALSAVGTAGAGNHQTQQRGQAGCDATVRDGESIQAAVDEAASGETVCVRGGTYDEALLELDAPVTVRGHTPAHADDAAVIDGSVSLDADGAELHRVAVTRSDAIEPPHPVDPFGIRVQASDTVVADSLVHTLHGETEQWGALNGIQVFGGDPISNVVVRDNTVTDIDNAATGGAAGIKLQANLDEVAVIGNTVTDLHAAGWAWGVVLTSSQSHPNVPKGVVVEANTMDRLNDGTRYPWNGGNEGRDGPSPYPGSAFGVDGEATAHEVTSLANNNLLAPNGAESKDEDHALDATCNWWGDRSGPTHDDNSDGDGTWALERGGAEIDFEPWLNASAPSQTCRGSQ